MERDWDNFVDEHTDYCISIAEQAGLDKEDVCELSERSRESTDSLMKFCRHVAYCQPSLIDEWLEICMDALDKMDETDEPLKKDLCTTLCILLTENEDVYAGDFLRSDYAALLYKWADDGCEFMQDYIYEHNDDYDLLYEKAQEGCQWAFDRLDFDDSTLNLVDFFHECETAGVDISMFDDNITEAAIYDDEFVMRLASLEWWRFLDSDNLATYSWVEDHLEENDKVAEIAAKCLNNVIVYKEDFKWLKKMADSAVPQAQYLMGLLYSSNDLNIIGENHSLARRYLMAAKQGGCTLAEEKLAMLEAEEQKKNAQAAQEAEMRKRKKQEAEAQTARMNGRIEKAENEELGEEETLTLASDLATGHQAKGIQKNANKATKLYRIVAKQGNPEAMYRLGIRLIKGEGCHKNWNAGMSYVKKAAKKHHAEAECYYKEHNTIINRLIHKLIK